MSLEVFVEFLLQGREIEFSLQGHNYFLTPDYEDDLWNTTSDIIYVLYACNDPSNRLELCKGNITEILNYQFGKEICLQNSMESFDINWVL